MKVSNPTLPSVGSRTAPQPATIGGTPSYLDEQAYRYNNRKLTDGERFSTAVKGIVGKRLTFDELTGKVGETAAF